MKEKTLGSEWEIEMLLIRGQFSHNKAKTRRIAPNEVNKIKYISLYFHVVLGMKGDN